LSNDVLQIPPKGGNYGNQVGVPPKGGNYGNQVGVPPKGGNYGNQVAVPPKGGSYGNQIGVPPKEGSYGNQVGVPPKGLDPFDVIEVAGRYGNQGRGYGNQESDPVVSAFRRNSSVTFS
jgi:hypothetical protein